MAKKKVDYEVETGGEGGHELANKEAAEAVGHIARIEGGDLIDITEDEVRQFRIYRDGFTFDHCGDEVLDDGRTIWVYRQQ